MSFLTLKTLISKDFFSQTNFINVIDKQKIINNEICDLNASTYVKTKISIQPKVSVFILFGIGISLICIMFFTFETLFIFSLSYILTIPISSFTFLKNSKMKNEKLSEEDHEDIL